ncbi:MAG: glycosyltransferase family 4 protein [Planctomycetes bacterium]|nr:glycosyltransferase family 4 protein [Planctomycetota bacterium]
MKILGLCAGDPQSPRSYSGSLRRLLSALDARGDLLTAMDVDRGRPWRWRSVLGQIRLRRRTRAARLLSRWTAFEIERRSERARHLLRKVPTAQAVLLYGTDFFPARPGESPGVPVGAGLDCTFAQLARSSEWHFDDLTPLEVETCIESQRRVFERCDWLFPRTEWCAQSLEDDYGIPRRRIVVTGAGPNLDISPGLRRHHDGATLLFVGRDWARKSGPLVVDAFHLAKRSIPSLRLIVVGPPMRGSRADGVEWLGPLDGPEQSKLAELFSTASLLVAPSRFEPFGIALLEAMQAGCPVISLDRGAAREIFVSGEHGERIAEPEPRILAKAIVDWLSDRDRLDRAGLAAQRWVLQHFGWHRAAERIAQAFGRSSLRADPRVGLLEGESAQR